MDRKGIYMELSPDDIAYLDSLIESNKKLTKVSIIRKLISMIRGFGDGGDVVAVDCKSIRLLQGMGEIRDTEHDGLCEVRLFIKDGVVRIATRYDRKHGGRHD